MKKRDIVIGLLLLTLVSGYYIWRSAQTADKMQIDEESANVLSSTEEKIEETFNVEIPDDVEKISLEDQKDQDSTGIATRKYADETFTHSVLADLPDPDDGKFYQGWLVKGEGENEETKKTSKLRIAKGGYLLEFESNQDLREYNKVIISEEAADDNQIEDVVLQSTF